MVDAVRPVEQFQHVPRGSLIGVQLGSERDTLANDGSAVLLAIAAILSAEAASVGSLIAAGSPEEILKNQHVREVYLGQEFRL